MTTFDFLLQGLAVAMDPMILLYALIGSALMLFICWLLTLALPTRLTLPSQTAPST